MGGLSWYWGIKVYRAMWHGDAYLLVKFLIVYFLSGPLNADLRSFIRFFKKFK